MGINVRKKVFSCMAFHNLELDLCNFIFKAQRSSLFDIGHSGMFSGFMEFCGMVRINLNDNHVHIYENHNLMVLSILLSKQTNSEHNQQHHHFYHSNMIPCASFCKESIRHNDSFFNIYVFRRSRLFSIVCHIEI